jgi:hypothetical protein
MVGAVHWQWFGSSEISDFRKLVKFEIDLIDFRKEACSKWTLCCTKMKNF